MKRPLKIALILIPVALLAVFLLLRESEPAALAPVPDSVTYSQGHTPAAPHQPVGSSCSVDCAGSAVAITCAEGETPVCDCAAIPASQCMPPPATP